MQTSVFFYAHDPLQGTWVDIDETTEWELIRARLFWAGHCTANYSGPVLASDTHGIAAAFVTPEGSLNLPALKQWLAADLLGAPAGAVVAYVTQGEDAEPSPDRFMAAYRGEWDSVRDFTRSEPAAAQRGFYAITDERSQAVYIFSRD